jgi:hypothetical protein
MRDYILKRMLPYPIVQFWQGVNFYTQLKTVTQMWREQDVTHTQAAVAMPTMQ